MKIFQPTLLLLVVFVLFQFMINGFLAQTSPCTWLTCMNNGTCYIDNVTGSEMCNCTRFYQGMMCEEKLPAFLWTPDELCQLNFGRDYYSFTQSSVSSCSNILCQSLSDPMVFQTIMDATGMLCGPSMACIDNSICTNVKNAPQFDLVDRMMGNITCQEYLNASNASYALSFCQNPFASMRCSISCQKYLFFSCMDTLPECPMFSSYCNALYGSSTSQIKTLCPYTCATCPDTPLRCTSASSLCQNGGSCQDVTVTPGGKIGFRCICPAQYVGEYCEMPNPCFGVACPSGKKCTRVGVLNYVCA